MAASFPSSYIATTSSAVTRSADSLSVPFPHPPQEMTVYVKFVERGGATDNAARIFQIGDQPDDNTVWVTGGGGTSGELFLSFGRKWSGSFANKNTDGNQEHSLGDTVEVVLQVHQDGNLTLYKSNNGGTLGSENLGSTATLGSTFSTEKIGVGETPGGARTGTYDFISLVVAPGVRTMNEMRRLAGPR